MTNSLNIPTKNECEIYGCPFVELEFCRRCLVGGVVDWSLVDDSGVDDHLEDINNEQELNEFLDVDPSWDGN